MRYKNILLLVLFIGLCILAGLIGSFFTASAIPTWYASLNKPLFNPPNYLSGPVWTVLYIMMGISLFFVFAKYRSRKERLEINIKKWKNNQKAMLLKKKISFAKAAIVIFAVQLVLNTLWSIIFFGLKMPGFAFFEIVLMWVFIFATIIMFYKVSKPAAYFLIPYLCWVSFATVLNYLIWVLN
jgi:tryptophan-rich sensory protein